MIITVEEFEKAVETFGFNSPVVTAIWNTILNNPDNQNEFEIIMKRKYEGAYLQNSHRKKIRKSS